MSALTLALLIFGLCYLLIMTERLHKTIVALFGAAVMISLGVVSQEEAFYPHEFGVDYNVVFLLIGMMVIVNIVRETGLFMVVFLTVLWGIFGLTMTVAPHLREAVLSLSSREAVPDEAFLRRCLVLLVVVNVAFCFHSLVRLEPATIALLGASLFMVIGHARRQPEDVEELTYLAEVEWKTIFFYWTLHPCGRIGQSRSDSVSR